MGLNPFTQARETAEDVAGKYGLIEAVVTSSPPHDGDGVGQSVSVSPTLTSESFSAFVPPPTLGDGGVPTEGSRVLVLRPQRGDALVLNAIPTTDTDTPAYEQGERVLSHPISDATVRFAADGTIEIDGDATVVINGGTNGIITDVETTTDADGHVTDVTLVRDTSIQI